jgi:rhomboid protease GluP
MSLSDPASPVLHESAPPTDLVEVGCYATAQAGFEHGLVVLALGRDYWLEPTPEGHRLYVEPASVPRVREHLSKFDRESTYWPPKPIPAGDSARHPTDLVTPLAWVAATLVAYDAQLSHPDWTQRGALDAAAMFDEGEVWRAATALFLHGDGGHLVSNVAIGFLLFAAVLKTFGRALGWVLVAGAAVLGNVVVAATNYPGPYRSLGASTAIFAGLGLLTGRALGIVGRSAHPHRGRELVVALGTGCTVFALYGMGGGAARVDIGAHLAGFLAGLVVGFGAMRVGRREGLR